MRSLTFLGSLLLHVLAGLGLLAIWSPQPSPTTVPVAAPALVAVTLAAPPPASPALPATRLPTLPEPTLPRQSPATPSASTPPAAPGPSDANPSAAQAPTAATAAETEADAEADTGATADAEPLANPPPPYPTASRRRGENGLVLVRVAVLANGSAGQVELARSSGYPRLDASALSAVSNWRFQPARRNGVAVNAVVLVPVRFALTA